MDINWLETDDGNLIAAAPFAANIAHFLGGSVTGAPLLTGARYVALGDSYSAGEGNLPFSDGGGPDKCDRSQSGSYAQIIAQDLGLSSGGTPV